MPRTASEFLAFILVCLAIGTGGALGIGSVLHRQRPGPEMAWCAVILFAALTARLSPRWRAELRDMTPDRARNYGGSALLILVALSLSWHMLSTGFGWGDAYLLLGPWSGPPAAALALTAATLAAVALILDLPIGSWLADSFRSIGRAVNSARERRVLQSAEVGELAVHFGDGGPAGGFFRPVEDDENDPEVEPKPRSSQGKTVRKSVISLPPAEPARSGAPVTPPIDIFTAAPKVKPQQAQSDVEFKAQRIRETLASFGVAAQVVGHHCGPVITQFDIKPDSGVKVKSITALQNDLALALAAPTIRIQAPVPGRAVVGIEIPNSSASMVPLRELLESEAYRSIRSPLGVVLGKDVAGNPAVIDLAKMPHLLIAGATGSGKSVCVNTLISCLLYHNTPEDVRLMMVDPKMVELTVYNGVPHLLSPVLTQMDKVVGVLQWAIREMERRYQMFADATVRNITRYNEKMTANGLKKLPYIVLIIDELADLMMVAPEDVEDAVCRLAQLARAAGIHLVIATQRPSVDVVTGLIKANFPARIAFAMTSQVDSRTILDTAGAEKLLGRGDMLYMPPDAPKPVRLQGAFLSDTEIEGLVEFWQRSPLQAEVQRIGEEELAAAEKAAAETDDELLDEAIRIVREHHTASVTLLQRKLRIGYARAARVMDQLEAHGVVGPADGSKQRPVLLDEASAAT